MLKTIILLSFVLLSVQDPQLLETTTDSYTKVYEKIEELEDIVDSTLTKMEDVIAKICQEADTEIAKAKIMLLQEINNTMSEIFSTFDKIITETNDKDPTHCVEKFLPQLLNIADDDDIEFCINEKLYYVNIIIQDLRLSNDLIYGTIDSIKQEVDKCLTASDNKFCLTEIMNDFDSISNFPDKIESDCKIAEDSFKNLNLTFDDCDIKGGIFSEGERIVEEFTNCIVQL